MREPSSLRDLPGNISAHGIIQYFRSLSVCLKKRERCDLELQPEQLLVKIILSVKHMKHIHIDGVRHLIVLGMEDSCKCPADLKFPQPVCPSRKVMLHLR